MGSRTVIKLNNIPHGFYEKQMQKYFSQFGTVKNVLVIRSEKTHKSRGFGFVEFELPQVAKSAAEAMHNYLLFNHVLKCRQMDKNDLPKDLFKKKYKGPTSIEKLKQCHNVKLRRYKKLKEHLKKVRKTEDVLAKLGIDFKCHIINSPAIIEELDSAKTLKSSAS